jgi:hypothetical protein
MGRPAKANRAIGRMIEIAMVSVADELHVERQKYFPSVPTNDGVLVTGRDSSEWASEGKYVGNFEIF